jgi:hypothetical protein
LKGAANWGWNQLFSTALKRICVLIISLMVRLIIIDAVFARITYTHAGSWRGNLNYWTGGVQGCKGQWGWCRGAEFQPLSFNLSWAQSQPEFLKSDENCMHMRVQPNSSSRILLSDRSCANRFILACQVCKIF